MARSLFFLILLISAQLSGTFTVLGQSKIRPLPSNINRPSINLYAPYVSGDGQTLLYLSDYTDDGHHGMRWATKRTVSTWNDGKEVTKLINRPTLNFRGGYSLSFDGDQLLFTSRKSGLGGFDLWYSKRKGNDWQAPKNFGMPINSSENEGSPVLSPDGQYLYFMRCDQMSEYGGATGCRLMMAKRNNNGWDEPVALPDVINTGNSQTPRILADGETLIFASDKFGGKGGLDLYTSTKSGESWTVPIPLDFINTEQDDQFISIPAKGRYLYAGVQGVKDRELAEILIPDEFQPKKVMRIQAKVKDGITGEPVNANLTVFNVAMRDRLWNEKTGPLGEFAIVLKEGAVYDMAIDLDDADYMYFSKIYNLDEIGSKDKESLDIKLMPLAVNEVYPVDIYFKEYSQEVSDDVIFELRRIAELLRKNPRMAIEIQVTQKNYREDSVQSDPDLTEVKIDSVYYPTENMDSLLTENVMDTDSLHNTEEQDSVSIIMKDSLVYDEQEMAEMDSLGNEMEGQRLELKYTYHNDRTDQQAQAIKGYLVSRGIEEERILINTSHSTKDPKEETDSEEPVNKDGDNIAVAIKILEL